VVIHNFIRGLFQRRDPFIISPGNFIRQVEPKMDIFEEEEETAPITRGPKLIAGSTRRRTAHEILVQNNRRRGAGGAFQFSQLQKLRFLGVPNAIGLINTSRISGNTNPLLRNLTGISLSDLIKNFNALARGKPL